MDQRELERRLEELAERVARLERAAAPPVPSPGAANQQEAAAAPPDPAALTAHLRKLKEGKASYALESPAQEKVDPTPAPPPPSTASKDAPPIPTPASAAPAPRPVTPPPVATPLRPTTPQPATPPMPAAPPAPATPPVAARRSEPAVAPSPPGPPSARPTWEQLIGGRWAAWVGALAVIVAGGFAVMIGIEAGLWGKLPPIARCLIVGGFGFALVGAGEFAYRKLGGLASVGLFSAGLGTLYVDAFATLRFFGLVNEHWALVLMGLVALLGVAVTVRTRFLTIGVLSLLGGYFAPILLFNQGVSDLANLMFLTALLGIALGLSAASPRYRPLRYLALAGQSILSTLWLIDVGLSEWMPAVIVFTAWWMMLVAETVLAALRNQSRHGNVLATLVATGLYVTTCALLLNIGAPGGSNWLGAFCLAIALIGIAIAATFGPGLDALRERGRSAMDHLAAALWAQAGALLIVAVALQFDGYGQTIGWLAIGVAAVEAGRRLPSRAVDAFGLITGALALTRVCTWDWWAVGALRTTLTTVGPITITGWSIVAFAAIAALVIAAHRLRSHGQRAWRRLPMVLMAMAGLGWLALTTLQSTGPMTTALWLLPALVLLAASPFGARLRYVEFAWAILLFTVGRWAMIDGLITRADPGWNAADALPLLNWQMALGVAIVAAMWWAGRLLARRTRERSTLTPDIVAVSDRWQWLVLGAVAIIVFGLTLEADRTLERIAAAAGGVTWSLDHMRQLVWTMLWSIGALGAGVLARVLIRSLTGASPRSATIMTTVAWVALSLCGVKWVLVDCLLFTFADRSSTVLTGLPFINLQLLAGFVLILAAWLLKRGTEKVDLEQPTDEPRLLSLRGAIDNLPVIMSGLILWGLSFEVDRLLERFGPDFGHFTDPAQARLVWWSALWAVGGAVMLILGRVRDIRSLALGGWAFTTAATIVWLTSATLGWRLTRGPMDAPVLLNQQAASAALLFASLMIAIRAMRQSPFAGVPQFARLPAVSIAFATLVLLWIGSLEIDRLFSGLDQTMGLQAGLSVYWAIFGAVLVIAGFRYAAKAPRYAGLALLAITMIKVLFVDLAQLDNIWRVVSFLVSGLLLIGVSMLYARLSPRAQQA